jgi:hypothetical protein
MSLYCGSGHSYLVTNGAAYGTVWDGRPEDDDFHPTGLSFHVWYRRWAEGTPRVLENERLLPRLRVGMTEAQVLMEVGGNWKKRKAAYQPIWYLESPDIPAQLDLDDRGIVLRVRPWHFIVARPT